MRGLLRPCRTHLGPELAERWQGHLCGLCLTLRDVAGQPERALTGYDVLLLSVLVEAQAGPLPMEAAAPCPLRGFRSATVIAADSSAAQLAAAGALLSGGAGISDKLVDGDLPRATRGPAGRIATRLVAKGSEVAARVGLDPRPVLRAPADAAAVESRPDADLPALLAPTGSAVAALFASTADVAGRPHNAAGLARLGLAFGQLVHLLDAVDDLEADRRAERFNPLIATATGEEEVRRFAEQLRRTVTAELAGLDLLDRSLVGVLLGRELERAVHRSLPRAEAESCTASVPQQRERESATGASAAAVSLFALLLPGVFIGGSWGGGGGWRGRRRFRRGGYGPPPGYGYGYRTGPSCGQMLACNCCANCACNACCCDGCGGDF
jgi:hypothetical protein